MYRNGDIFPSVWVLDFVFVESGVLQLNRAVKGELYHDGSLAFGTSVTEMIVRAAIGSFSSPDIRKPSLSAPA